MTTSNPFFNLPPGMAIFLFAGITTAMPHVPRQTPMTTLPHRTLDVIPFPSWNPLSKPGLELRQDTFNTVCGFIGGDPDIPATCWAGSHCVLDAAHSAVGCCPNGGPCTTGVFTGCVDFNSGAQTAVNPYVFTCSSGNVCYKNEFDGGFSQFGCGTASNLGTSVATQVDGSTLLLTTASVPFTETASSLETPTTLSSPTSSSSSSSSSSSTSPSSSSTSSSSSSSSRSSSTTSSPTSSSTNEATEAPAGDSGRDKTGAIIGGTLSGVAILIFLIAMGIYFWRRKKGNTRKGPGVNPNTQYISPVSGPFAPIPGNDPNLHGTTTEIRAGAPLGLPQQPPQVELNQYPGSGPFLSGAAIPPGQYSDTIPLTRDGELDDFQHTFNEALSRIGEEDEDMYNTQGSNMATAHSARNSAAQAGADGDLSSTNIGGYGDPGVETDESANSGNRPLWQQGRRQSRNLMWM